MFWGINYTFFSVLYMFEIIHNKKVNKRDNFRVCSLEGLPIRQTEYREDLKTWQQ